MSRKWRHVEKGFNGVMTLCSILAQTYAKYLLVYFLFGSVGIALLLTIVSISGKALDKCYAWYRSFSDQRKSPYWLEWALLFTFIDGVCDAIITFAFRSSGFASLLFLGFCSIGRIFDKMTFKIFFYDEQPDQPAWVNIAFGIGIVVCLLEFAISYSSLTIAGHYACLSAIIISLAHLQTSYAIKLAACKQPEFNQKPQAKPPLTPRATWLKTWLTFKGLGQWGGTALGVLLCLGSLYSVGLARLGTATAALGALGIPHLIQAYVTLCIVGRTLDVATCIRFVFFGSMGSDTVSKPDAVSKTGTITTSRVIKQRHDDTSTTLDPNSNPCLSRSTSVESSVFSPPLGPTFGSTVCRSRSESMSLR